MTVKTSIYDNHLIPAQDWGISIAENAGFTLSMLRFAISFFGSVPLAILLRRIRSPKARHWYSFLTGFFLIYYPFGNGTFHAIITSTLTYIIMARFRRHAGTLAWLIIFPYLILAHIRQASGMAWKEGQLDFTGAQMMLTLKLIAIAICYQDGARKDSPALREYARNKSLERLPSLLEFYSYCFAAGNLLSGPFHEAKDYFDFIERRGVWNEQILVAGDAKSGVNSHTVTPKSPSPAFEGTYRFIKALMCAVVWMGLTHAGFSTKALESTTFQHNMHPLLRPIFLWATIAIFRFKYYFVWGVSEAALVFSGFGFNGYDEKGRPRWDRYINSRIRGVELNSSLADTPRHWNICTGLWLRHYVYERLTPPHKKPSFINLIITQLISGVWHGVFPGYWLFFATSAFMFQASRMLTRYEQNWPEWIKSFFLWRFAKVVMTEFVLNYAGSAFVVLSFQESMALWRSVGFFGHVWIFGLLLIGAVMPPRRRKPQDIKPEHASASQGLGEKESHNKETDLPGLSIKKAE